VSVDTNIPRSRRAMLAGLLGAAAASVASALGRPAPSDATNGGAIVLGSQPSGTLDGTGTNEATAATAIYTTTFVAFSVRTSALANGLVGWTSNTGVGTTYGVFGRSDASTGRGAFGYVTHTTGANYGVYGQTQSTAGVGVQGVAAAATGLTYGVYGQALSPDGTGVYGFGSAASGEASGVVGVTASPNGTGVTGYNRNSSGQGVGVYGSSGSTSGRGVSGYASSFTGTGEGVYGQSNAIDGTGVTGHSGNPDFGTGVKGTVGSAGGIGVLGWAFKSATAVMGVSTDGTPPSDPPISPTGVYGEAVQTGEANGVYGRSTIGQGVRGEATSGIGVQAVATNGGLALAVLGRAAFSRSGRAIVPAGASSVDITVVGGIASNAAIIATIQGRHAGVHVEGVRLNYPSAGMARIYLNKVSSASATTPVGWLVLG